MFEISVVSFVIVLFVVLMLGAVVGLITGSILSVASDDKQEDNI